MAKLETVRAFGKLKHAVIEKTIDSLAFPDKNLDGFFKVHGWQHRDNNSEKGKLSTL